MEPTAMEMNKKLEDVINGPYNVKSA